MPLNEDAAYSIGIPAYDRLCGSSADPADDYDTALHTLNQTEIRALMREAEKKR